jgi:CRP/FNR family cyclic AMP-dependent transcriptional regulator
MTATPIKQSLLSELQEHLSTDLFASATPVRLAADAYLFLAGDAGDGCYRVEDGLVKVTMMSRSGVERILAFLGPGAIVGELAIVDGRPRSASVVAVREAALKFLSRSTFEEFAGEHPEVYKNLVKVLATRLRQTKRSPQEVSSHLKVGSRGRCSSSQKTSVGTSDPAAL